VSQSTSILLLGDGAETSRLRQRLARHFLTVESARTIDESRELGLRCRFHLLVVVDPEDRWSTLQAALEECEGLPSEILLIAEKSRAENAVEALRGGVSDVLLRPFSTEDLVATVNAICGDGGSRPSTRAGKQQVSLVGNSGPIREIRAIAGRIAPSSSTVLVEGEAGTGRKRLARLLHEQSGRQGPFVPVDCSSVDADRLERELLGQPVAAHAATATLFLGDIHHLPLDLQAEMLRSMEQNALAAERGAPVATRIIASTDTNLGDLVARQRFREDLYHRLNALRIGMPPLRERREDIPLLVANFVESLSAERGLSPLELKPSELDALGMHDWPGNVQELRSVVEQTLLRGRLPADAFAGTARRGRGSPDYPLDWTLEQVKRHHMTCVLEACKGNKAAAARRLDISRKTLDRKLGTSGHE
jgi:DNA-binding NtrC family response regulator